MWFVIVYCFVHSVDSDNSEFICTMLKVLRLGIIFRQRTQIISYLEKVLVDDEFLFILVECVNAELSGRYQI